MSEPIDDEFTLNVRVDDDDDRDRVYPPSPIVGDDAYRRSRELFLDALFAETIEPLPESVDFEHYRRLADPTRQQKDQECTGFALASIADYHLRRNFTGEEWAALSSEQRRALTTSRRMVYEMAQIFDGQDFERGSTLRGALKGWKRLGVSSEQLWPYDPDDERGQKHGRLTLTRITDAVARPGGVYYRIEPGETDKIRDALARGCPLYASADIHVGWFRLYLPSDDDVIERRIDDKEVGNHAFVIVGYDARGLWIHNSWGPRWGRGGFGQISWAEWAERGTAVWFVVPPHAPQRAAAAEIPPPPPDPVADHEHMWRHLIVMADDGRLANAGPYALDEAAVKTMLYLFAEHTAEWPERRLAVFADGGYWSPETTIAALRPFRDRLMAEHIFPIFLVWEHPWYADVLPWLYGEQGLETLDPNEAEDFWELHGGATMAKVLAAESVAPRVWAEVAGRSRHAARRSDGAARLLSKSVGYKHGQKPFDIHLVAHGTGALLAGEFATLLDKPITSVDLWAPALNTDEFSSLFGRALASGQIGHVTVRTLDDEAEQADHFGPIPGSVLSVASEVLDVANLELDDAIVGTAGDGPPDWGVEPVPIVGMERFSGHPVLDQWASVGLLTSRVTSGTHIHLLTDDDLHQEATADILSRRVPAAPTAAPVDPLAAIRDPLARAIAEVERDARAARDA